MPFVFTAAAVAFVWLLDLTRPALRRVGGAHWRKPMARWAHYAAGGAVLVWIAWFNLSYYFNDLASAESTRWVFLDDLVPALVENFKQGNDIEEVLGLLVPCVQKHSS